MSFPVRWVLAVAMVMVWVPVALGLDPRGSLLQYGRQVWATDNGLPQNTVRAVVQTPDGYIWFGTDDGLVRFNGVEFKVFTPETTPELRSGVVQGLTVDQSGALWVVTRGGLTRYAEGRFQAFGVGDGLPAGTVWFVHEDLLGRVWVAAAGGLCVMRGERCSAVEALRGVSVVRESRFADGGDGTVWVADGAEAIQIDKALRRVASAKTAGGAEIVAAVTGRDGRLVVGTPEGLQVERRGSFVPVTVAGVTGRMAVATMLQATDKSILVGTAAGLVRGSGDRFALVPAGGALRKAAVESLFQDREGTIWMGTDHGVGRVTWEGMESFPAGDALASCTLLAAFEDREGDVWLGTESDGLTMLHEQRFTTYTTAEGLSGNVVRSVLQDAKGTVWVGTDGAGLNRRTANGFATLTTRDGLSSNVILSLASAANGDLWVGTPTGLNLVRDGSVKVLTTADGLVDDYIRSLLVDRAGNVWVGTRHGLTRITRGHDSRETMTTFTALDGLGSDFIGVMVEAADGDLWIGTGGGLTRMRGESFKNFTVKDGLLSNVVTALLPDGPGGLWLGGEGSGLSHWTGAGAANRVDAKELPTTVFGILADAGGALWISSRSGVFRREASGRVTAYDTTDGLRVREGSSGGHPEAFRMQDGTLWFATLRGVSVVDPARLHENSVAPPMVIETVLVNDVPRNGVGELVLAPGSQRVEFRYAGLSFVAPQKVRYQYQLEGFDKEWIEAGTHRAAFYTNLRPGRYTFRVRAENNDGVQSTKFATMVVRVRPFFWQTWWFYVVLVLLAAGLAYLIYTWRVRRVKLVYGQVMEERSRIAREIHDTLAQGIVSISLQLEVVTRLLATSPEAAKSQLDETRALVRQSLADARSSIWDLRSEGVEELPVRVGRALKSLTGPAGMVGRLQVTGTYRALAPATEDELLRIAQEAVSNAVRHAGCGLVEVTLVYEMKAFRLLVVDDGRGFDATVAGPAGHFGLQGMKERAAKIGGQLDVASAVGGGTRVGVALRLG